MKLVCLSDTHGYHEQLSVPRGQILIHAGDCTRGGRPDETRRFARWLEARPHPHKILVPGNHERGWDRPRRLRRLRERFARRGIHLLHDTACTIHGLTFYGTAWQPCFRDWAFNVRRGHSLRDKYARIPGDVDVLVTHVPPRGILDRTPTGDRVGSRALLERVRSVRPRLHVFGHVHGAHGEHRRARTLYVNGSVCGESGRPRSAPRPCTLPHGDGARVPPARSR